jgi:hypothetical protein
VTTTADGIVAIVDTPCATRAVSAIQAARESGIAARAGVHTGECEWLGTAWPV